MKKLLLALLCIISINIANAQNVNIPDALFKERLVNDPAINFSGRINMNMVQRIATD